MRRALSGLLSLLLAASIAGCAGGAPTPPAATAAPPADTEHEPPPVGARGVYTYMGRNLRVQLYSDTLLRVEEPRNGGYTDEPSFCCANRGDGRFAGVRAVRTEDGGAVTLTTDAYRVTVPKDASSVADVTVSSIEGRELWRYAGRLDNLAYLPEPRDTPEAWAFNDSPRLIPSADGFRPNGRRANGWRYDADAADYYVFLPRGDAAQLRTDFNLLTGACDLVPLYALGLWFSRFYPLSDRDALRLMDEYRARGYPLDVFVADTDWRKGGSVGYEPDPVLFPDMDGFLKSAAERRVAVVLNDHVRAYSGSLFDEPQLRWFGENLQDKLRRGLSAWWYDRNWSYALESPFRGYPGDLLGQAMYRDLTDDANGDLRTLLLSNAHFVYVSQLSPDGPNVAAHRYSVQWTGDIGSGYEQLRTELENAVYLGATAGLAYLSSDIGGFTGNPDERTFIRWTQYGALSGVMRYHSHRYDRTPWKVGERADRVARVYLNMRYRLLPLYYSLARLNYETGLPIMRRLDFSYPQYPEAADNTQYLLGDAVLVAPIVEGVRYDTVPSDWLAAADGSPGLDAAYYPNRDFAREPRIVRVDRTVDLDAGEGAAAEGMPKDDFSVRWTGRITNRTAAPAYLGMRSDDGMRVYIDGTLALDRFQPSDSVLTENLSFWLEPGVSHEIRIDYYEMGGRARASLLYAGKGPGERRDSRTVFLPDGEWADVWSGEILSGPAAATVSHGIETSPIFVRLGSLLVLAEDAPYADASDWDRLTVDVYPGGDFSYTLYEDDGRTEAYRDGAYRKTRFDLSCGADGLSVRISPAEGAYETAFASRRYAVRVHLLDRYAVKSVRVNGVETAFTVEEADAASIPFAGTRSSADGRVAAVSFYAPIASGAEVTVTFG